MAAVFTVVVAECARAAVVGSTVVVAECARVAVVRLVAVLLPLHPGLEPGEVLLLLVSDSVMVLPVDLEIIFRALAAVILQTGMSG
ncbi:MAG TPA: hypothetical protein VHS29_03610 [Candidatus Acidoferrales bacterium]|nr:hypothetical protein [Candidatus Acidoferrales bacterium]